MSLRTHNGTMASDGPVATTPPLRVFLIDDHALFRTGLRDVFREESGIDVVGESGTGGGSLESVVDSGAQVVLVDLRLPDVDGIEVCRSIVLSTEARCVVLTSFHASEADLVRAAKAGASAYLVKGIGLRELVSTIRSVAAGANLLTRGPSGVLGYS